MPVNSNQNPKLPGIASIGACILLLFAVHLYRPPTTGLWFDTLINSAHVFVFLIVAPGVLIGLRRLTNLSFNICILGALVISMLLGLLSEAAQIQGPRDASLDDLLADWLGAATALALCLATRRNTQVSNRYRVGWGLISTVLLLVAIGPLIIVSAAYIERNLNVPVIYSFDSIFSERFIRLQNASLIISDDLVSKKPAGTITFDDGPWPGAVFHNVWPNWSDYSTLAIDMGSAGSEPIEVHIRVHDQMHSRGTQPYSDRFNMAYLLKSGRQQIRIPLHQIRQAPATREMDLSDIAAIVIFATENEVGKSVNLGQIRLEK